MRMTRWERLIERLEVQLKRVVDNAYMFSGACPTTFPHKREDPLNAKPSQALDNVCTTFVAKLRR